jgi:uncharacterized protein (DUF58 family)
VSGTAKDLLGDEVRERIARLEITASSLMEGLVAGQHRSPYHGFSVEFAQHREYTWGDELKHVDWKVFARTDRFYVKQYEEETNLQATVLLDQSESMLYRGQRARASKYEYGATLAAALGFVLLRQQDAIGLCLFDEQVRQRIPASAHPGQLRNLTELMSKVVVQGESGQPAAFHHVAEELRRRGLVVLISDLLFPREVLREGLRHLRHRRHEVVVLHLVDPDELDFPFQDQTRFEGLEAWDPLTSDPRALREAYLEELRAFLGQVEGICQEVKADYLRVDTSIPPAALFARWLRARERRRGRR